MDSVTLAKGSRDFGTIEGNLILKVGGGDWCKGIWV